MSFHTEFKFEGKNEDGSKFFAVDYYGKLGTNIIDDSDNTPYITMEELAKRLGLSQYYSEIMDDLDWGCPTTGEWVNIKTGEEVDMYQSKPDWYTFTKYDGYYLVNVDSGRYNLQFNVVGINFELFKEHLLAVLDEHHSEGNAQVTKV